MSGPTYTLRRQRGKWVIEPQEPPKPIPWRPLLLFPMAVIAVVPGPAKMGIAIAIPVLVLIYAVLAYRRRHDPSRLLTEPEDFNEDLWYEMHRDSRTANRRFYAQEIPNKRRNRKALMP